MTLNLASWPAIIGTFVALLGAGGVGSIVKAWLDHKRGKRKDTDNVATALVDRLTKRMEQIENSASRADALCEAKLSVLRHRMNNLSSSFDGLLLVIEMAPDNAAEFVTKIKQKRTQQEAAESDENAAVNAAILHAAAGRGASA